MNLDPESGITTDGRRRQWILIVVCLGALMIVLDSTIVNVALPSIRADLGFSESSLVWVVNAYLLTFGGFLLLGGRLGDLFGHRRLFLLGIVIFTLASLGCGLAESQRVLIGARALQGAGGAVVSAVALSLVMSIFTEAPERAKAMGIYGFVSTGGGSMGLLLGGALTSKLNWHWIFLVNLPIGAAVYALGFVLLPQSPGRRESRHLDIAGAAAVTTALMIAVYAIVNSNKVGWGSPRTIAQLAGVAFLLALFVVIEARARAPLMPLRLFRQRNLVVANVAGMLLSAAMFAWIFNSALYMQVVLKSTPLQVGLSFLPSNLIMAAFSLGLSAKVVIRFGIKRPLVIGLLLAATGLVLFARAPVSGNLAADVIPCMLLLGLGCAVAFSPLLLAAMSGVAAGESGLASGVMNTCFMMGGALGLAILAGIADARTEELFASGTIVALALNGGYHIAFLLGAVLAAVAALLGAMLLHIQPDVARGRVFSGQRSEENPAARTVPRGAANASPENNGALRSD
jgi:EmrB/QacA subfamily drug resistance transporter